MNSVCEHKNTFIVTNALGEYAKGCEDCCTQEDFRRNGYFPADLDTAMKIMTGTFKIKDVRLLNPDWLKLGPGATEY